MSEKKCLLMRTINHNKHNHNHKDEKYVQFLI